MDAKHIARNLLIALALLLVCVSLAILVFVHTAAFRNFVRSEIGKQAFIHAGARVEIGAVAIQWAHLGADLRDISVYGANSNVPVLQAQRLQVGVRWSPLLHKRVELSELILDKPIIRLAIDSQGRNNLPKSPQPSSSNEPDALFNLAIGDCAIRSGEVYYNDVQTPLEAEMHDLKFDVRYSILKDEYAGSMAYDNGRLLSKSFRLTDHAMQLQFTAKRSAFLASPVLISIGSSHFTINASLTDYANPAITGTYDGSLSVTELARAIDEPSLPRGNVALNGSFSYKQKKKQSPLNALDLQGKVTSERLQLVNTARNLISASDVAAAYHLSDGNLRVQNLSANALGARARADFEISQMATSQSTSRLDATIEGLSLRTVSDTFAPRDVRRIPFMGVASANVHALWQGSISDAAATARLSIASHPQPTPAATAIPVNGLIQVSYNGRRGELAFGQSSLQTASTTLSLTGTLKPRGGTSSELTVSAMTRDLHEVRSLVELVQNAMQPDSRRTALPELAGSASLQVQISGSTKNPSLQGRLAAQDLTVGSSHWRSLALDLDASPSHAGITDGSLLGQQRQQITFSGTAGLHDWALPPSSPISLQVAGANISLADVEQIANLHYPIQGMLTAKMSVNGTREAPEGNANLTLANALAYGQRINRLTLDANSHERTVHSTINLQVPGGTISGNASYEIAAQQYTVQLAGKAIALDKIASLGQAVPLQGMADFSASGAGTWRNPQLDAQLTIPQLQVHGQTISNIAATIGLANERVNVRLNSNIDRGGLEARGTVQLTGDEYTTASLDIKGLPIAALVASLVPSQGSKLTGQLETHLAFSGPLKAPSEMQAHLEIPPLGVSYGKAQLTLMHALIADYRNGDLTIAPTQIQGPGTNLTVGGTMSLKGGAVYALTADGSVDLGVIQQFAPQVRSAGQVELHVRSGGSLSHPGMQGQLQIKNAVFTTETLPVSIEGINAQINLNGSRADIASFSGNVGGGTISARGFASLGRNTAFNIGLNANSVRIRYPHGLRSVLTAQLNYGGTPQDSTLSGRVLINTLSFTQDFDLSGFTATFSENSTGTPPSVFENSMKLALAVQSSQDISLASSKLSIGGSASLNVTGTMANPVLLGRIALNSGEVFFLSKRFEIQSGTIDFADPVRTNPLVSMYIKTKIEGYDITLNLTGPVDRLRTNYTSDPALPPADIIHLLAFGNTTEEAAAAPSQSAALGAESVLAQGVTSQLAGKLENLTGISQLSIDPLATNAQGNTGATIAIQERVTGNLLVTFSTDVTQTQGQTAEVQYQLNSVVSISVLRDQNGGYGIDVRIRRVF